MVKSPQHALSCSHGNRAHYIEEHEQDASSDINGVYIAETNLHQQGSNRTCTNNKVDHSIDHQGDKQYGKPVL